MFFLLHRNPSQTDLTRRYDVGCKLYHTDTRNLTDIDNTLEKSEDAMEVSGPVELGAALYVECCVAIGDSDPRKYFSKLANRTVTSYVKNIVT